MQLSIGKEIQIGLLTLLGITLLLWYFGLKYERLTSSLPSQPIEQNTELAASGNTSAASNSQTYTLSTISQHSTPDDCWLAIDQQVFSVSSYINQHPGGARRIIEYCGQDATQAFNGLGGHIHSTLAKQILQGFKIGTLKG